MKYRHAHKEEYVNYFNRLAKGQHARKQTSEPCLECGNETPQRHNKFCSTMCYAKYRVNHKEEYEDAYQSMRNTLRKLPDHVCSQCDKNYRPNSKNRKFCSSDCYYAYSKEHPEEYAIDASIRRAGYEKFRNNMEAYDKWRDIVSNRMKDNNPMHVPEVKARSMKSCKKYWDTHPKEKEARIKRFMQAPLRGRGKKWKPTSLERKIIDLNVPGLNYVGDGSVFVTIGAKPNRRKKNPDFLLKGRKKVVEVGDIEYWHTLDEIEQTVKDYECIGYECLYLTNRDLEDLSMYETRVRDFCSSGF